MIQNLSNKYKNYINKNINHKLNYDITYDLYNLLQEIQIYSIDRQHDNKNKLIKILVENIKSMAIYDKNKENQNIYDEEKYNNLISSSLCIDIMKQLYLENYILKEDLKLHIHIIQTVWSHLGNNYLFDYETTDWEKLINYMINLYYLDPPSDDKIFSTEKLRGLVRSIRYLEKFDIRYKLIAGDIELLEDSDILIHNELERNIKRIGGINTLRYLFKKELRYKYNKILDRYLINRQKITDDSYLDRMEIPYNYLINISGKFLDDVTYVLTEKGLYSIYSNIITISKHYLEILNLRYDSIYADYMIDYEDIPIYIKKNTIYENLCIPNQYNPKIVIDILDNLYRPFYDEIEIKSYSFSEYLEVCKELLLQGNYCVEFNIKDLFNKTKIKKSKLKKILLDISENSKNINCKFDKMLSEVNLFNKPLVKLKNNNYFLVSPHFCGYSFIKVIEEKLIKERYLNFNRRLGLLLEDYIKNKLEEKNFKYKTGHYSIDKQKTKGECDIVLETEETIAFVEVKKRSLPESFEVADDIGIFKSLAEGMIHAQIQGLRHKKYMEKNRFIRLYKEENYSSGSVTLEYNDRTIILISLCLFEYGYLTNTNISSVIMESLLISDYMSIDKSRQKELEKLKKQAEKLRQLVFVNEKENLDIYNFFYDTVFRTLQQFLYSLKFSNNLDELIDKLTFQRYLALDSFDFYEELLFINKLKYSNKINL